MKPIKQFHEFLQENIVRKQSSDKSRAGFLVQEAEKSYRTLLSMLEKLEMNDENANQFIKSCYDILMELIRAKMLLDGYNALGLGAHEAEVSYLRVLGFREIDVQFVDQLRFLRNGMLYYGTQLDKEYALKVVEFTKRNYREIQELIR